MKFFRIVLTLVVFVLIAQDASAKTVVVKRGETEIIEVGETNITVANTKGKSHIVVVEDYRTEKIKMYLDSITPGFKMGMSIDEFGEKKVTLSCEQYDIIVEVN